MTIEEIYQKADSIFIKHLMINNEAMKYCQSWGLNGFKRWHRCLQRFLMEKSICLENNMFDYYSKILDTEVSNPNYKPVDFNNHITTWKAVINSEIIELGNLNKEHFSLVGVENYEIKCVMEKLVKINEKLNRYYNKFSKVNWNWDYIYYEDNKLHEKMKEKEKEEGYNY